MRVSNVIKYEINNTKSIFRGYYNLIDLNMKKSLKVHIPVVLEYYYRFSFHCICNKMINKDKETGFYLCFNETKDLSHVV